jgi:hypothetical protein
MGSPKIINRDHQIQGKIPEDGAQVHNSMARQPKVTKLNPATSCSPGTEINANAVYLHAQLNYSHYKKCSIKGNDWQHSTRGARWSPAYRYAVLHQRLSWVGDTDYRRWYLPLFFSSSFIVRFHFIFVIWNSKLWSLFIRHLSIGFFYVSINQIYLHRALSD